MTEGKRNIIQGLLWKYDIETADDIHDALKELLSGILNELMETEMDDHLGYDRYEHSDEKNYRNDTKSKRVRNKYGEFEVDVPQDRNSSFDSKILPKRQKVISAIEDKIISMYAKGMTTHRCLKQSKIFMDLKLVRAWYLIAQISYYLKLRNGKIVHLPPCILLYLLALFFGYS